MTYTGVVKAVRAGSSQKKSTIFFGQVMVMHRGRAGRNCRKLRQGPEQPT